MWSEDLVRLLEPSLDPFTEESPPASFQPFIPPQSPALCCLSEGPFPYPKEWDTAQWEWGSVGSWESSGRERSFAKLFRGLKEVRWEHFAASLGRSMKKSLRICLEMKTNGELKTLQKYEKLHSQRKKNASLVSFQVSSSSKNALFHLYTNFCDIAKDHSLWHLAQTWTGPAHTDGHSRNSQFFTRPQAKTWSFAYQQHLYSSVGLRKYFYFFIQFLDYFGEYGEGTQLCTALRIATNRPEAVKMGLLFQYLRELGLEPYDGKAFSPIFYIQRSN